MNDFDILGKKIGNLDEVMDWSIAQLGVNYNHFAVLYTLMSEKNHQCTQKFICDEWLIPKQTVFNICKDYKEKGWIEFFESPTDKREKIMQLTDAGKAHAEPIWQASNEFSQAVFHQFGKKKTEQLFALLDEFCQIGREQIALNDGKKGE